MFDTLSPNRSMMSLESEGNVFSSDLYSKGLPSLESFSKPSRPGLIAQAALDNDGIKNLKATNVQIFQLAQLTVYWKLTTVGKLLNLLRSMILPSNKMVKLLRSVPDH